MAQLLNIHHGFNFRDLGGYRTTDGRQVAPHRLVRASKLDQLSERDQAYLADYGVRWDVDFRSPEERDLAPDRVPAGATYHFDPVFPYDETQVTTWKEQQKAFAFDAQGGYKNMLQTYQDIITNPQSQTAYRQFFDLLLQNETGALLFHCSAGKDRTGMGAAFVLAALDVPEATIRTDYMTTNQYVGPAVDEVLTTAKAAGANANTQESLRDLWIARSEYLDTAFATVTQRYGSMRRYLSQALDLTDTQVAQLKQLYLL
ncbi:tyrosine-protein phosphatase [Lacticaseibacillus daqingensis]|uniref:tyrosine-protein phosphatase n=1 Tax=Lacticaseibacillus daqingensis TaxID=2486014 RepID=UPI000F79B854|nr:tyrosine-protein phosphatase [Lacticaseibacillus daqingensis]